MSTIKVTGYTVYPTGYDETEIPSDKFHFVIRVEDRGKGWAVCWMGDVLGADGSWDWEPRPSSRDDAFYEHYRFTERRAKALALEAVDQLQINGRTFAQAVAHCKARAS